MKSRRTRLVNGAFLVLGVGLLVVLVWRMDAEEVLGHIREAGWYLLPAFAAYVGNLLFSSWAWHRVFPRAHRPPFLLVFGAFWAGHGVNMVTPGGASGTVLKATILGGHVDGDETVAALMTHTFLNWVNVVAFTVLGPALCLLWLDLPTKVVAALFATSAVFALALLGLRVLLRRGLAGQGVRWIAKLPFVKIDNLERVAEKAERVDARVRAFRRERPGAFRALLVIPFGSRLCQALEVWFLLRPLIPDMHWAELGLLALLTQSTAQLINWATAFVPGRVGVAEGGAALLFELLSLDPLLGLAFGLLRRVRKIVGVVIGLLIGTLLELRSRPEPPSSAEAE